VSRSERLHRIGADLQATFFVAFLIAACLSAVTGRLGWLAYSLAWTLWTAFWLRWELRQVRRLRSRRRYDDHLRKILDDVRLGIEREEAEPGSVSPADWSRMLGYPPEGAAS
jgi:hypothetical protein